MKKVFIKITLLLALTSIVIYFYLTGFNQKINLEYYRNVLSGKGYAHLFIYIGICIVAPNLMFPFTAIIITGGIVFGYIGGIILSFIGGSFSAIMGYYIARLLGRETISTYLLRGRWANVNKKLSDNGILSTLIIRTIGIPFGIQNYLGGVIGISFIHYMLGTLIGMLPLIVGLTLLGESLMSIDKTIFFIAMLFLIAFYTLTYFLAKKFRKKVSEFDKI